MREGMVALMDHDHETGPVNIGNPTEFTMLELAKVWQRAFHVPGYTVAAVSATTCGCCPT